jgi:hypothetical protein
MSHHFDTPTAIEDGRLNLGDLYAFPELRATSGTPSAPSQPAWQAGLILRQGNAPLGVGPQPDDIGSNLDEIAGQLIGNYQPGPGQ